MKPTDENSTNYLMVSAAAKKLGEQACTLGIKHIKTAHCACSSTVKSPITLKVLSMMSLKVKKS